jgi:tetratricopeptide (TPR) repeat protein
MRDADELLTYREAGRRLDRLAQAGFSWSGHERNCAFLNIGPGRFAEISAVSAFDFDDDGRSLAVADWDHDGDLDVWVANRTGPRLRFLRNDANSGAGYLALRLQGARCNRDAIGARVEVELSDDDSSPRLIRTRRAAEGFLGQSSKWIHFGLGAATAIQGVQVRWPDGSVQRFGPLTPNGRYVVIQGEPQPRLWRPPGRASQFDYSPASSPSDDRVRSLFPTPVPLPPLNYQSWTGRETSINDLTDEPLLLLLWASSCQPCLEELRELAQQRAELEHFKLHVLALSTDSLGGDDLSDGAVRERLESFGMGGSSGKATDRLIDLLQTVHNVFYKPHRPLAVPSSFLIKQGRLAAIYQGRVAVPQMLEDVARLQMGTDDWRQGALPFPGRWQTAPRGLELGPLAAALVEQSFVDEAESFVTRYRQELRREAGFVALLHRLGSERMRLGDARAAQVHFEESLAIDPDNADGHYNLGIALAASDRTSEAMEHYARAIEIDPHHARAINNLGNLLAARGETSRAEQLYQNALSTHPRLSDVQFNLALLYMSQQRWTDARQRLRETLRIDPGHAAAHNNLGTLLANAGDLSAARQHFQSAVQSDPQSANGHHNLASALVAQGQRDEAIEHYQLAVQLDPELIDARLSLGRLYFSRRQYTAAVRCLEAVVQRRPDHWEGVGLLAWLLATHPDPAIRDGARAVKLAEQATNATQQKDASVLDVLAAAYAEVGQFEHAVKTAGDAYRLYEQQERRASGDQVRQRQQLFQQRRAYRLPE